MNIEECVSDYLEASTGINDKIVNRIYPVKMPQDCTLPALTYRVISGMEHHNIDVAYPRFQFSCFAKTYGGAKELCNEVQSAFQRMKVPIGGTSGKAMIAGEILNEIDMGWSEDTEVYGIFTDIRLIYRK